MARITVGGRDLPGEFTFKIFCDWSCHELEEQLHRQWKIKTNGVGVPFVVWYARNPIVPQLTTEMLRLLGTDISSGVRIKRSIYFDNVSTDENSAGDFSHLSIGKNTYVGDSVYFDLANKVAIGDVTISGGTSFVTHADCNRSPYLSNCYPRKCNPIRINDGSWVGFGATILQDVEVGAQSVIAANSLVRHDVQSRTIIGGMPAKRIADVSTDTTE